jgi:hypothetical protein
MVEWAETCDSNWLYKYDTNKPLLSQTVYNHKNVNIINISKIFTNGIYFGINMFFIIGNQMQIIIKCKDSLGDSENSVEDKNYIINRLTGFLDKLDKPSHNMIDYWLNITSHTVDIELDSILNHKPIINFCYKDGEYAFTNLLVGNSINRSLYSADDFLSLEPMFKKTHLPKGQLPDTARLLQFHQDTKVALSNVYTYVNTEYSDIKVYRKII